MTDAAEPLEAASPEGVDPEARWEAVAVHKAQELASMSEARAREIILSLGAVDAWRARPDWSGLVEQQALFHRGRRR